MDPQDARKTIRPKVIAVLGGGLRSLARRPTIAALALRVIRALLCERAAWVFSVFSPQGRASEWRSHTSPEVSTPLHHRACARGEGTVSEHGRQPTLPKEPHLNLAGTTHTSTDLQ
jgi:hypothetical protein